MITEVTSINNDMAMRVVVDIKVCAPPPASHTVNEEFKELKLGVITFSTEARCAILLLPRKVTVKYTVLPPEPKKMFFDLLQHAVCNIHHLLQGRLVRET